MSGFIKKAVFITLLFIFGLIVLGVYYWFFTPIPKAFLIKRAFTSENEEIINSTNFENALKKVEIVKNIEYNSTFPDGTLDIIFPKKRTPETPVIFWTHGGGFVGGDKSGMIGYGVELAAHGFIVVNINYALAPRYTYPTPVIQLGEAYTYIKENAGKYKLKLTNVYFAGDSAGAQITAQFIIIQTSPEYAKQTKINPSVDPSSIKGVILDCGPYDLAAFAKKESSKELEDFIQIVGWSYFGKKEFQELPEAKLASVLNYVTKDFPPAFITDGNTESFEDQGKALVSTLESKGVIVDSLFFNKKTAGELGHEYQFKMDTSAGKEAFNKTLEFLNQTK